MAWTGSAGATVFLNENFDGYADQTAFQAAWTANTTTATLSTEQAFSPTQSVKGLTTTTRNLRTFGEMGTLTGSPDLVIFRIRYYDSAGSASAYRQYAELDDGTAPSASMQLIALGLSNNLVSNNYMARVLGYTPSGGTSGSFFKLDDVGAPTRSTGWHKLEARISDTDVKFYVDDVLSKTADTSALTDRSYDTAKVGSNLTSTQVAYFDDVYVERTPEPATALLLVTGGLLMRRRRTV